ncbi:MAG: response regulator transcription factor [Mycobacterium sp.]|nr:response regulator transcription factor [Mycobacterium sp.]
MSLSPTGYAQTPTSRPRPEIAQMPQIDYQQPFLGYPSSLRTTIVANDELLRHGLVHVVSHIERIRLVGDLRYGEGLAGRVRELRPELLVLGMDRTLVLSDLLAELDVTPRVVVVMDSQDEGANTLDLLRAGADALVDRRSNATELRNTFNRVINGQSALDSHSVNAVIAELRCPRKDFRDDLVAVLTAREREVLDLLVEGLDNRTIAAQLFVSEATVKFHLQNIMKKLGVHKRAALISVALRGQSRQLNP